MAGGCNLVTHRQYISIQVRYEVVHGARSNDMLQQKGRDLGTPYNTVRLISSGLDFGPATVESEFNAASLHWAVHEKHQDLIPSPLPPSRFRILTVSPLLGH